ncbi:hypothetical protein AAE02nite_07270 [Adhaeribacter aerolatus]|uniref:Uncharacterized protein n=1 Tax=Adhaeribacter aerolatus TaxID=670289 RepID=A0A512ATR7_9BACT|nr:hypothetical protein [Adhaeribacter aerolatus]GEO03063.1 hypothetical protein AAE02nite_07270 [Adhaeribacter aerolatus]
MHLVRYIPYLLFINLGCSSATQLPDRQVVLPNKDNLYSGTRYKNIPGVLDEQGVPLKSMPYFNFEDFADFDPAGYIIADKPYDKEKDLSKIPDNKVGLYHKLGIDSATVRHISSLLFRAKEPVLNNFFIGNETYRFIRTSAFHDDLIIRLFRHSKQAEIHITRINKKTGGLAEKEISISLKQYEEFKELLNNSNFWALQPYKWVLGVDGSHWTIEAHVPYGYKVLSRFHPGLIYEDELLLRRAGQWLISKSGLDVKENY